MNAETIVCGYCGQPPVEWALINDQRFCHQDDQVPSCYEKAQWEHYGWSVHIDAPAEGPGIQR